MLSVLEDRHVETCQMNPCYLLCWHCHSRPACTFYKFCTLYQHKPYHVPLLVADATVLTNVVIMLTLLFPGHVSSYSCLDKIKGARVHCEVVVIGVITVDHCQG